MMTSETGQLACTRSREWKGKTSVGGDALVSVAIEAVVDAGGAERVAAAAAASVGAVFAVCTVVAVEGVATRVVHELAFVADAEVLEVA
jgi:hypothetical protein